MPVCTGCYRWEELHKPFVILLLLKSSSSLQHFVCQIQDLTFLSLFFLKPHPRTWYFSGSVLVFSTVTFVRWFKKATRNLSRNLLLCFSGNWTSPVTVLTLFPCVSPQGYLLLANVWVTILLDYIHIRTIALGDFKDSAVAPLQHKTPSFQYSRVFGHFFLKCFMGLEKVQTL